MSGGRAFVLGASSGLGAHLARRLAEEGWEVLGTGRRTEADLPGAVRYLRADLEVDADRAEVAAQLHDTSPDLIVHSAVTYGERSGSARSLEAIDAMFRVNASAPFVLLRDHLAALPADRACSCVVVNSDSIFHANQTSAEYAATKAALRVLTAGLASACRGRRSSVATLALAVTAAGCGGDDDDSAAAGSGGSAGSAAATGPCFPTDSTCGYPGTQCLSSGKMRLL